MTGGLVKAGFHEVVVNDETLKVSSRSRTNAGATHGLMDYQTIEARKTESPDRPLIRVSSTFFWTLSADHDLAPIPDLAARAHARRADAINLGRTDVEEEVNYETLRVGQQVQKYASPPGTSLLLSC